MAKRSSSGAWRGSAGCARYVSFTVQENGTVALIGRMAGKTTSFNLTGFQGRTPVRFRVRPRIVGGDRTTSARLASPVPSRWQNPLAR
jgi:ABC-type branched-subunit amino acid transport system ATPase component